MSLLLQTCFCRYQRSMKLVLPFTSQLRFLSTTNQFLLASETQHEVRIIDENGQSIGIMSHTHAKGIANEKKMKLVQIAKASEKIENSVYKLINHTEKKPAAAKTILEKVKEKELTMKSQIAEQDLRIKAKKLQSFLDKGFQVTLKISKPYRSKVLPRDTYDQLMTNITCNVKLSGTPKQSNTYFRCVVTKDSESSVTDE